MCQKMEEIGIYLAEKYVSMLNSWDHAFGKYYPGIHVMIRYIQEKCDGYDGLAVEKVRHYVGTDYDHIYLTLHVVYIGAFR